MPLQLSPLPLNTLSAEVQRAVNPSAPAQARAMAARGLVPMGPEEIVTALYQLSFDADSKVAAAAHEKAPDLPQYVLNAALGAALDPMILDFFAHKLLGRPDILQTVLGNREIHDETLISLAPKLEENETELLARNQERLLKAPAIIEALYFNPKARMSTVQRMLEMAARRGLELKKVPHYKEMMAGLRGEAVEEAPPRAEPDRTLTDAPVGEAVPQHAGVLDDALDSAFNDVLGEDWEDDIFDGIDVKEDDSEEVALAKVGSLPVNARIRLATLGSSQHRQALIKDSNRLVALAAISSPAVSDTEAARYAGNRSLNEDVIRFICNKKEWHKNYTVKVALMNNPKAPLHFTMRFLTHMRDMDLKNLSNSRNIQAALSQAAKRLVKMRKGGGKR